MCDWMAACAGLLEPIVEAMIRRVLASKVIGTDDTPVKVQDHAGKGIEDRPALGLPRRSRQPVRRL